MALSLNKQATPVWVTDHELAEVEPSVVGPDADAAYLIRPMGKSDMKALRKPFVKMRFDKRTHTQVEADLSDDDSEALSAAVLDFMLVDWRGYVEDDGITPMPCTPENKRALMERDGMRVKAMLEVARSVGEKRSEDRAASFRAATAVRGMDAGAERTDAVLHDSAAGAAGV